MFRRLLYAECDICRKRILLNECNSISTSSVNFLRQKLKWQVCRNGRFICKECQAKPIFPVDWSKYV